MMGNIVLRILSFLGLVELVWLVDMDGEEFLTIKRKGRFSNWAHVYPIMCVGRVTLKDDGTCAGESRYIKKWMPY